MISYSDEMVLITYSGPDDVDWLRLLVNGIHTAPRMGNDKDIPEGARYISISDTLANMIADRLEKIAERLKDANTT